MTSQLVSTESVIISRTPEVIAIEIRSIESQAKDFVLRSAIEIGTRLEEAKDLVKHGEWAGWLESNVSYSQSTANNFMRVSREYANTNSNALANLSYTQAVALLAVPADEREEFAKGKEDMSSRELQQAIKAQKEAEQKLKKAQEEEKRAWEAQNKANAARAELENLSKEQSDTIRQLNEEVKKAQESGNSKEAAKAKTELRKAEKALSESQQKLTALEADLDEKLKEREQAMQAEMDAKLLQREQEIADRAKAIEDAAAKQLTEMQELLKKNNNTAGIKVKLLFQQFVTGYKDLVSAIAEIEDETQRNTVKGRIAQTCDEIKASVTGEKS